jgi:hypothetical protein
MARKAKQTTAAPAAPRTRSKAAATQRGEPRATERPTTNGDLNRLRREAAWSQMFGRVESKNPFTR